MLEPHVLGEHWHSTSVLRRKHFPVAAVEGASLSDSTHKHVFGFLRDPLAAVAPPINTI
jgi:hypothetical protein